jgi:uronate dehydrogenase
VKILVTGGATQLSAALAAALAGDHQVRLTERSALALEVGNFEFERSELGHDQATNELVRGMDAIVHSGEIDPNANISLQLDAAMRCTYNLLWAAAEEGVPRVVYLSSLRVMDGHGEDLVVTETWRPVPTTDPPVLCYHLGEYVCREFGRERRADVVCLRFGDLVWDAEGRDASASSALYVDDAVQAVEKALAMGPTDRDRMGRPGLAELQWHIYHIQSAVPNARYVTWAAMDTLGYEPASRY